MSGIGRDILNLPGNIVRGAGSIAGNMVDGTMHAVSSVGNATGIAPRRVSIDGTPVILRDKLTLNVKSTPERTAACMTTLSLKNGPLLKKNEQGVWSRRYATLVPHFFLYYFENERSREPQGIIDLEFCTDITVQNDNIIKIGAGEVYESRTFFFQADDGAVSNEWASAMQRERYGVVKDERDAYHELQDQFSAQLDMAFQQVELSSQEKDRVQAELTKAIKDTADAKYYMKKLGTLVGVSEEDVADRDDMRIYGEAVILATEQMKTSFASQNAYELEIRKQEHEDLHDKIERLERELEAEVHNRRLLEAQNTLEKREAELRLRDAVAEVEKATVLVEALQKEHQEAGEKAAELFEQKKILVKEVKQLRKKLALSEETQGDLTRLNAELSKSAADLKGLVESLQERNKVELEETLKAAVIAASQLVDESATVTGVAGPAVAQDTTDKGGTAAVASADQANGDDFQWERRRSSLQNIDWLVPEQRSLLQENLHQDESVPSSAAHPVADVPARAEIMSADPIDAKPPHMSYATDPVEPEPVHESFGDKIDKISFSKFVPSMSISSIFKDKEKDTTSDTSSNHGDSKSSGLHMPKLSFSFSSPSSHGGLFSNSTHGSAVAASDPPETAPGPPVHVSSPSVPRCYRCGGTVEGPKYSTCKCAIPAMTPLEPVKEEHGEDSGSNRHNSKRGSMSDFMGMLSRGIDKVTPGASKHNSFHAALELDENRNAESAAPLEPTVSKGVAFLEVEDGDDNVKSKDGSHDLLGLGTADIPSDVHAQHDELQADI